MVTLTMSPCETGIGCCTGIGCPPKPGTMAGPLSGLVTAGLGSPTPVNMTGLALELPRHAVDDAGGGQRVSIVWTLSMVPFG